MRNCKQLFYCFLEEQKNNVVKIKENINVSVFSSLFENFITRRKNDEIADTEKKNEIICFDVMVKLLKLIFKNIKSPFYQF